MENKKKLIYADDLKNLVNADINRMYAFRLDGVGPLSRFLDQIDQQPDVDAVKVMHGRWMQGYPMSCSVCGGAAATDYEDANRYDAWLSQYCPNCGAKMDLEC